jgi:tRNA/tmRNA/rRNA uracil-C5-methylase (TrmA/RlmC/RlmD family)
VLKAHDEIELTIEKPAAGGRMIARHEGQVVLVSGAIPGERVRARVQRADRSVAYATVVDLIEPHRDRRQTTADWSCGGNVYAFIAYERQLRLKSEIIADAFARIGRLSLDRETSVTGSREDGYRMRARLQVQAGRAGFFREATHELCEPGPTGQLLPETIRVFDQLGLRLRATGKDTVLAIELSENMAGSERALHLQLRPGSQVRTAALAPVAAIPGVRGVSCQVASGAPAVRVGGAPVVGDTYSEILGSAARSFAGLRMERHAHAFFQGNRYLLSTLVQRVLAQVPESGRVADLYAGVGLFALSLAAIGRDQVIAVEGDRASGSDLRRNATAFGTAVDVQLSPVEAFLRRWQGDPAATLILDPPRTGLSRAALEGIIAHGAAKLVYVSCDIATLARDVRAAVARGYRLAHIEAFDLFPNTAHVETLAVLER